ncbi:MAG: extracellular solute-binding protein, partial [Eubacterium sp.]|nr:extracellular solute-binding protein [Eubacterium sp.]
ELNICVWEGVFSEENFSTFEKEHNCKVNVTYIDNTDTMISKLVEGSAEIDLCDIETAYVKTFVEGELLQKMDHSKIANEKNIDEEYYTTGPIGDEKFEYTVPDCATGYTAILYNKETCPIEIKSFKDLADPALKGKVALINSTISLYGAALEALGYSAASTDEKEIAEANELLTKIKENTKAFVGESAVSVLETGECSVALSWDYATMCFDNKDNWEKFAVADIDSNYERFNQYWGITSKCENTELAYEFINFMLSPEATAKNIDEWGQVPLLKKEVMEDLLPEGFYENPVIEKYQELSKKSWSVAVDDEQISLMDNYYTLLMGGN